MHRLRLLLGTPWVVVSIVTLVTLSMVGAVVVVATPAGCKVGLHLARCQTQPTALVDASPSATARPSVPPTYSSPPPPAATASAAYPSPSPSATHNPAFPPYQYDASMPYSPIYSSSSQPLPANLGVNCRLPVYAGGPGSGGVASRIGSHSRSRSPTCVPQL